MTTDVRPERANTDRSPSSTGLLDRLWVRYAIAVVMVGVGFLLRLPFAEDFGSRLPFVTLSPAVFVAAVLGGFGPGLLATNLATVGAASGSFPQSGSSRSRTRPISSGWRCSWAWAFS